MKIKVGFWDYVECFYEKNWKETFDVQLIEIPNKGDFVCFDKVTNGKLFRLLCKIGKRATMLEEPDMDMEFYRVVDKVYDFQNNIIYLRLAYMQKNHIDVFEYLIPNYTVIK